MAVALGLDRLPATGQPTVIRISRRARTLRLYEDGHVARTYPISAGARATATPRGMFEVENKVTDPHWFVPDRPGRYGDLAGKVIPPEAPENRIRARWLGFCGPIGIHGTDREAGAAISDGCVLMEPGDVVDLYERVDVGTPVIVV